MMGGVSIRSAPPSSGFESWPGLGDFLIPLTVVRQCYVSIEMRRTASGRDWPMFFFGDGRGCYSPSSPEACHNGGDPWWTAKAARRDLVEAGDDDTPDVRQRRSRSLGESAIVSNNASLRETGSTIPSTGVKGRQNRAKPWRDRARRSSAASRRQACRPG
jgi:hypothetical protein